LCMSAVWRPPICARKAENRRLAKSFCGCRIWITPKPLFSTASVPLILGGTTSSPWSNSSLGICSEPRLALNRAVVLRFRLYLESLGLAAGTINQRLAAVRRLAYEAADSGLLSPELAAGIRCVKGVKQLGSRLGNWLSGDQAKLLLESADGEDLRSIRDLAMMAVLLGCGLRRAELSALEVEDMEVKQGHWAIVDLIGKGSRVRTVPMPMWVKEAVDRWIIAANVSRGRIFRAVSRHGTPWGKGISENVIWHAVRRCAERTKLDHLAPHDLRRTCAKLCHTAGGEIEQIQFLLGHASVLTTERYLGCKQNLEAPVNDRFGRLFAATTVDLR
jgi:site-specific recombinase XerC